MGDFTMPSLGADMEAGTLVEWKVKVGDVVKRGDIVAVVETQKGAIEVEIFESGRVDALLIEPGTRVPVGAVMARIDGAQARPAEQAPSPRPPPPPERLAPRAAPPPPVEGHRVRASPAARVAARELHVDLEKVSGSGPGGAITREDVERAAKAQAPQAVPRRAGMRQAIAAAMSRSKREIPHYYLTARIDVGRAMDWLRAHNEPLRPADRVLPIVPLLKATGLAVRKAPEVNGFFENGAFRAGPGIHLGIAISLREGGLVVPALHDVAEKPIDALSRELADLIERSRRGQLRSSELSDATLTVTSLGDRGVEAVQGIIFPPQVAIVGFGRISDQPWVVDGRCVPRPILTATLAADHRVSDGHRGGLFLSELDRLLQSPEAL